MAVKPRRCYVERLRNVGDYCCLKDVKTGVGIRLNGCSWDKFF